MPMRLRLTALIALLLLASAPLPPAEAADYAPQGLFLTVYSDGVVEVDYRLDVDPTLPRVTIPLFGSTFTGLTVLSVDGLPLSHRVAGGSIAVDSLGASGVTVVYTTSDLTGKVGALWSVNVTAPTSAAILLPEGSTVVGASAVPLQIGSLEGHPLLTLPAGSIEVNYLLGAVGSRDKAFALIREAEQAVRDAKANSLIVTAAESQLTQAKAAFSSGDYPNAERLSIQAKASAASTQQEAAAAEAAIKKAVDAVGKARSEGRTEGLQAAEASLTEARSLQGAGSYGQAILKAGAAYDAAAAAKAPPNILLYTAGALVAAAAVIAVYYVARRRAKPSEAPARPPDEHAVDLELVFQKNPSLRVDDKEAIRFLAQRGGDAYANEIRERFDIPRTSAWRMIQRLEGMGIVEEKKVGGQSLISVTGRYRRPKA